MRIKLLLLSCLLLVVSGCLFAQTIFYGLSSGHGTGKISRFETSGNSLTSTFTFANDGTHPMDAELVEGEDGKLYGTTMQGGTLNKGVIFSFNVSDNSYSKLHDLTSSPTGVLIKGSGNRIFGMTNQVIFSYDIANGNYSELYVFTEENGTNPVGGLTPGPDGKYYGITGSGGDFLEGVIFSFDTLTNTFSKLFSLSEAEGSPKDGVCLGSDNKFYGTTIGSTNNYAGILFSFDPVSLIFSALHNFSVATGDFPTRKLSLGNDSRLYGVTSDGGSEGVGVIFSYQRSTNTYTAIHNFDGTNGGRFSTSLTLAPDGKFYGASDGGSNSHGIIFSLDPSTGAFTNLHDLDDYNDDELPTGRLLRASNGKLYGMTSLEPGEVTGGKIFSYEISSDAFTRLFDFIASSGVKPYGNFVKIGGILYGLTSDGGYYDRGVLFSYQPASGDFENLHDFDLASGSNPYGSLVLASDAKLYGMTNTGGASDNGVIFSFDPSNGVYTSLHDFDYPNGAFPRGALVPADNGKLYGLTMEGGTHGSGIIFSFDPSDNSFTKVFDFQAIDGGLPEGTLVKLSDGKLYGMAAHGGANGYGVIFRFDPVLNAYLKLYDFNYTNGKYPTGDLLADGNGILYGLTSTGGINDRGVLFSYNTTTGIAANLHDFGGLNGTYPYGSLAWDQDGKLYGMTSEGGSNGLGIIFSYDLSGSGFSKLADFNGTNGGGPRYSTLIRFDESLIPLPVKFTLFNSLCTNNIVKLSWRTEGEQNSEFFKVQKSVDGSNWQDLGVINASGTSVSRNTYTFTDVSANSGKALYRIVEYSLGGSMTYSAVLQSSCAVRNTFFVSPNPVRSSATVYISVPASGPVMMNLYNQNGAKLLTMRSELLTGLNQINMNVTALPKGVYTLTAVIHGQIQSTRFIKN